MSDDFIAWVRDLFGRRQLDFATPLEAIEQSRVALAAVLPFERIETTGKDALADWERLRRAGRGWPIVVGTDEDLGILAEGWSGDESSPETILSAASSIEIPVGIRALRDEERRRYRAWRAASELPALGDAEPPDMSARHGDWPDTPPAATGLTVACDYEERPHAKVHILLIPTDSGADVPAFLRWGGWNENPAPEYHVAVLRNWHERYGAELVGMSHAVLNLRVPRGPQTRDQALALAEEQFVYCEDIVTQGTETLEGLAASLLAHDWWYFWWD